MRDLHVVCEETPGAYTKVAGLPAAQPASVPRPFLRALHLTVLFGLLFSPSQGAGRGLYVTPSLPVANRFAPPPPLISIPTSALLNAHTLRPHYPKSYTPPTLAKARKEPAPDSGEERPLLPLTANQLLTLHLALHHPESPLKDDAALPPNPWALYFKSLPPTFSWHHPLTWLVRLSEEEGEGEKKDELRKMEDALEKLMGCLPARAQMLIRDVEGRFKEDVKVLKEVLVRLDQRPQSDDYRFSLTLPIPSRSRPLPHSHPAPLLLSNLSSGLGSTSTPDVSPSTWASLPPMPPTTLRSLPWSTLPTTLHRPLPSPSPCLRTFPLERRPTTLCQRRRRWSSRTVRVLRRRCCSSTDRTTMRSSLQSTGSCAGRTPRGRATGGTRFGWMSRWMRCSRHSRVVKE